MAIEPRLLKGALVIFETPAPVPTNLIAFQYNPDSMSRSLAAAGGGGGAEAEGVRGGDADTAPEAPTESFELQIELDATEGLEREETGTLLVGLHPKIAQLELLLYPPSTVVILNKVLSAAGSPMVTPPERPKVLFIWGPGRVLPVRVTAVTVEEQAFDQRLNPIRASARVGLRTLTQSELCEWGPPFEALAVAGHVAKEVLGRSAGIAAALTLSAQGEISF
jgi:hypothetical protein